MKKLSKKSISIALLSMMLVLPLQGCGSSTDKDAADKDGIVTLKIYAQYSDEDTKIPYDYAVEQLAEAYPNVKLELDVQAQDDGQKLQTYAATGNLPDIYQVSLNQINNFKESDNILVLDDYLDSTGFGDKVYDTADNILYNNDGHCYAFPYAGNEMVLWFYNKDLFEQYNVAVPTNYDELLAAVKTFRENDITPLSIFAKEKWPCVALYDTLATGLNPAGVDALDKGTALASDDAYTTAAERLHELVKAGMLPEGATNLNYDQAASLFYEGKAAMFINGQWEIQASTEKLGDSVDWMWYPTSNAGEVSYAMSGGGAPGGYAVSPYSENKDLAVEVAAFISEKYCEAKYMKRANPLLAVKVDSSIEKEVEFPAMMQKLSDSLDTITSYTKFDWGLSNPTVKVALEDQSQFLLTPDYTPEEFVTEIDKAINEE